jgi:hypothetical protein
MGNAKGLTLYHHPKALIKDVEKSVEETDSEIFSANNNIARGYSRFSYRSRT